MIDIRIDGYEGLFEREFLYFSHLNNTINNLNILDLLNYLYTNNLLTSINTYLTSQSITNISNATRGSDVFGDFSQETLDITEFNTNMSGLQANELTIKNKLTEISTQLKTILTTDNYMVISNV